MKIPVRKDPLNRFELWMDWDCRATFFARQYEKNVEYKLQPPVFYPNMTNITLHRFSFKR